MSDDPEAGFVSDVAFSPSVKRAQQQRGSREGYQARIAKRDWSDSLSKDVIDFIADRDSFYLGTASDDGQPYIQHRGGPRGFLKVIDDQTLAFADFAGNKQYISIGNLAENDKAYIFLMDYFNRRRIKLWGRMHAVEDDADLLAKVTSPDYRARPERVFVFKVAAWDANCPQHIPQKVDRELVEDAVDKLTRRVAELETEVRRLRGEDGGPA